MFYPFINRNNISESQMFQWDTECKQNTERNQVPLFGQVIIDGCQLITSTNDSVNKQLDSHFKLSSLIPSKRNSKSKDE